MFLNTRQYYVYILSNYKKTVLYTGMTNNLEQRIVEHYLERGNVKTFTGRYYVFYLLYYECTQYVNNAITREKEIKSFSRKRKEELINSFNPQRKFLNHEVLGNGHLQRLFTDGKNNQPTDCHPAGVYTPFDDHAVCIAYRCLRHDKH